MALFDDLKNVFAADEPVRKPVISSKVSPEPAPQPARPQARPLVIGERGSWETATGKAVNALEYTLKRSMENRHFLITGTTGAGKSRLFYQMFDQIRDRGDKAIIVDHGGENIMRYYRPGDVILNPFDARFPGWSPFNEIREEFDHDNLGRFVIPDGHGSDHSWHQYAQSIYSAVSRACEREEQTNIKDLLYYLLAATPEIVAAKIEGEPAAALFMKGSEKMAANARSILGSYLTSWRYIDDKETGDGGFSIRDWVSDDSDRRWVFVSYREPTFAALRGFISMAVSIAINYALDLPTDESRRIWFSLDEMATLPKMAAVTDALTKIRKKGGCVLAGLQSYSQKVEAYGKEGATTLAACFNTWISLRPGDAETAELFSKHFGEQEAWRQNFSDTSGVGGGNHNTGESISTQMHNQRVVTYTELMMLPDLCATIKLPGNLPVGFLKVPYIERPNVAEAYIPRVRHG